MSVKTNSFLEIVKQADNYPYPTHKPDNHGHFLFKLTSEGDDIIGILEPRIAQLLQSFQIPQTYQQKFSTPIFINSSHSNGNRFISFSNYYNTYIKRTEIIGFILKFWRDNDVHVTLRGWRNENYPVIPFNSPTNEHVFELERSGASLFGVRSSAIHLNGYIKQNNEIKMWIARRSPTKKTWPNTLDNMVAGGIAIDDEKYATMIKESMEEASIPYDIASKAVSCGALSYITHNEYGISPEIQYIFDLELSPDFVPIPNDGEVSNFYLMTIDELKEKLLNGEIRAHCGIIIIDFLIRHGFIQPDDEGDYSAILQRLHRPFNFHYD